MTDNASRHTLAVGRRIIELLKGVYGGGPITRDDLLSHLQLFWPDMNDREMRRVYSALPICTSAEGLYIPRSSDDIKRYLAYITPHVSTEILRQKAARLREAYPRLFDKADSGQLTLGMEG